MAKAKLKKDKSSSNDSSANAVKQTKKQKKKKFWLNHPKIAAKISEDKKGFPLLPPKTPQHFSTNWIALQGLLKKNVNPAEVETTPKKGLKVTDKNIKEHLKKSSQNLNGVTKKVSTAEKKVKSPPQVIPTQGKEDGKKEKKHKLRLEGTQRSDGKTKLNEEEPTEPEIKKEKKRKLHLDATQRSDGKTKLKKTEEAKEPETQKIDIWFDDVDPDDIEAALGPEAGKIARKMQGIPDKKTLIDRVLVKEKAFEGLTRTVAMDCEMVGVGSDGEESILARVSLVNQFGKCVYDKFVKPTEKVTDYRTAVSGIRPRDITKGESFKVVQKEVSEILKGRILVGHALHNDLKILFLDHPKKALRDTQKYKPFKQKANCGRPSLKLLCEKILNVNVQTGEHSSVQDAQAAMRLYTMEKKHWEAAIKAKYSNVKTDPGKEKPQ
ncbi:hypothetical protein GDO86_014844 [Hymenochirus boettgeri]|uniref:RNA exonuclease 4 n=1 Tax=Hymenochirus boettgeri TaxID=247094 RepID=A0A8T2JYS6_9PIPI|nr:hypothetical protein GDO86_014844 [Hymenochirus boettgeri]